MKYTSITLTDPGKLRSKNEDSYYENSQTGTYVVCDGIGGEAYGELASQIAIETIKEMDKGNIASDLPDLLGRITQNIEGKRRELACKTMGTTLALLSINGDKATAVNIGDSRIYRYRDDKLEQISEDHTMVYQMYLNGALTKEEARLHKRSHILFQYLGMSGEEGQASPTVIKDIEIRDNDLFIICSDGLSDMLSDEDIEKVLQKHEDLQTAASALMYVALESGGKDNITIIGVKAGDGKSKGLALGKNRKMIISIAAAVLACIIAVIIALAVTKGHSDSDNDETTLMESSSSSTTSSSSEVVSNNYAEGDVVAMTEAEVGDLVEFGSYEQDNDTSNGKEAIEWRVLAREDGKLLLISKYALDAKRYNEELQDVTWADCTLRTWLNNDFMAEAFSEQEREKIQPTSVTADPNPKFGTGAGIITQDQIFLLSIDEAEKYFTYDEDRMCLPTEYAVEQGAKTDDDNTAAGKAACWWWLRTPGQDSKRRCSINAYGKINEEGTGVTYSDGGIVPACWVYQATLQ